MQSSIRVKMLVGQIVANMTEGAIDSDKVAKLASGSVNEKDVRAAVAALHFVLASAGSALPPDVQHSKGCHVPS